MNTKETSREQFSALADGELPDAQLDAVFAALRSEEGKADWELYHRIGDALRSDDIADVELSTGFSASLAARLDAEPTVIAPALAPSDAGAGKNPAAPAAARRWFVPGLAAAASMAGIAFFATPHLMVASGGSTPAISAAAAVAENRPAPALASTAVKAGQTGGVVAASVSEGVVLRDARVDEYLAAHQRFSPSLYSSAQYARSTPSAAESGK